MVGSNVQPTLENQEILTDDHKFSSDKEKAEMANNNVPSTVEEQEIKMDELKFDLDRQKIVRTATAELEHRGELFKMLVNSCFDKCVEKRYKDGDLNVGEISCINRCASKYMQVNNLIGHIIAYGRRDV